MIGLKQKHIKHLLLKLAKAPREQLLIAIPAETGCTAAELTQIKVEDFSESKLKIGKRSCPISRNLLELAQKHLASSKSEFLFSTRQSPQMSAKRAEQLINKHLRQIDASYSPQTLRYFAIRQLAKKGAHAQQIAQQLNLTKQRIAQIIGENKPAETKLVAPISKQEQSKLEQLSATRNNLLVRLQLETGLTVAQATNLRANELSQNHIEVEERKLNVTPGLAKALKNISGEKFVFSTRQNPQMSSKRAEQITKKILAQTLGRQLTPNALRKTAASRAADQGASPKEVAQQLGLTEQYAAQLIGELAGGST